MLFVGLDVAHFLARTLHAPEGEANHADAIVALTGGSGRLAEGVALLQAGQAGQLFISGVNRHIDDSEVERLTSQDGSLFACCITIGRNAIDTVGNAREAAAWVRQHGYTSLLLVTADYHMPRAELDFRIELPDVTLIEEPVHSQLPRGRHALLLVEEYAKYNLARLRYVVKRLGL